MNSIWFGPVFVVGVAMLVIGLTSRISGWSLLAGGEENYSGH
ncbi:MAG: hypothetical protein AAB152_11520 [Candidatus Coatesbacteria bacterium]